MPLSRRNFLKFSALGASYPLWRKEATQFGLQCGEDLIDVWKQKYAAGARLGRALATLTLRVRRRRDAD